MKKIFIILIFCMLLTGCGANNSSFENKVENQTESQTLSTEADSQISEETASDADANMSEETASDADVNMSAEETLSENSDALTGEVIEIREKMFVTQILDIYYNVDEYKDKQLTWEGIYTEEVNTETNETYCSVIRYAPGCCGDDGIAGFEIFYDGEKPAVNDWVTVTGTLTTISENGYEYLAVEVTDLTVLTTRGAEFVSQ